jgi:hypothetical protein
MSRDTKAACPHTDKLVAKPFSIRLTDDERKLLLDRAGKLPLSTYVRNLVLEEAARAPRQRARRTHKPIKDHETVARLLAALGQSRIASNLNQLAKAVNIGVLPVTPKTENDIGEACTAVVAMRRDLMGALGFGEEDGP